MAIAATSPNDTLALIFWLLATGRYVRARWRQSAAKNWPLAEGAIEQIRLGDNERHGVSQGPAAHIRYSYKFGGEFYGGEIVLPFDDEDRAFEFLHRAKGAPVRVSVHPDHPEVSSITREQFDLAESALLAGVPLQFESEGTEFALPVAARALLYLLVGAAALALAITLVAHLGALAGRMIVSDGVLNKLFMLWPVFLLAFTLTGLQLDKMGARGRRSPYKVLQHATTFLWLLCGFYYVLDSYFYSGHNPLVSRQALCSLSEFLYVTAIAALYPAAQTKISRSVPAPAAVELANR